MNNVINLEEISAQYKDKANVLKRRVVVCAGTGCAANGAHKVIDAMDKALKARNLPVTLEIKLEDNQDTKDATLISGSGCQGFCQQGPLVSIMPDDIYYVHVRPEDVEEIVETTLVQGKVIERLLFVEPLTGESCVSKHNINFYKKQTRLVLGECGEIDPENIYEYIAHDRGYWAAKKAYLEMEPTQICDDMIASGLRGRGGGGFPTGTKWALTLKENNIKKYVICNGDEGDPGAFMDRSLMEGNPHRIIEGMMIAARAIGADEGYVYVRLEYPLAVKRIIKAVEDAEKLGILGHNVFGTGKSFTIKVMEGAGAFVCGEETALMASIEGKRGMPTPKPPFPAQCGLWGKPTVINNVETLATVPVIMKIGVEEYRKYGTEKSPGTKTFALTGHVVNTGLIEVPFGTPLGEIVYNIGGGVTDKEGNVTDKGFKSVQIGGPSGACLTKAHENLPLDFDSLASIGAMVGSGGLVVMNHNTCMVSDVAMYFMQFTQNESCGKCVPCREGTKQMLKMLTKISEGNGTEDTLVLLETLANAVKKGSLCALGKTAPNPVLSTLGAFRDEYEAHVNQKRCPTNKCKALVMPEIIAELCKGCSLCSKVCPVGAITGEIKKPYVINAELCIKCGECAKKCKFKAVAGF